MNIQLINRDIVFDEPSHTYTHKTLGKFLSVTTLLSQYKEPFDKTGFLARRCAQNEGITVEEILKRWKDKKDKACNYGIKLHSEFEHFLKTGEIKDTEDKDIIKELSKIKYKGTIFSELGLHSIKYSLAGTCDVAVLNKNQVTIFDLKSNAEFTIKSKYGKKYLYPIENIPESHLHGYSLQILIYGEMIKEHGYKFEPGDILWINPETRKVQKFEVLDLTKEVKLLLDHYHTMQTW